MSGTGLSHSLENRRYFNAAAIKYGQDIASVGWQNEARQQCRFEVLLSFIKEDKADILDVGCGKGDLYHFLKKENYAHTYTGIDISEEMIRLATVAYPNGKFMCRNFYDYTPSKQPDYCIANGVFNLKTSDNMERVLKEAIMFLLQQSEKGLILNVLTGEKYHKKFHYYDPKILEALWIENHIQFEKKEGYLENCVTYALMK